MFGAALGLSPYCSRQKLWRLLTGRERQEVNDAMRNGTAHESDAVSEYEIRTGNLVVPVGFVSHPRFDWCGVSPDGFVGTQGVIEAKCPVSGVHERIPDHYLPQIHGVLAVSGRAWADFISWTPEQTNIIRADFDATKWGGWEAQLVEFWEKYVLADVEPPRKQRKK